MYAMIMTSDHLLLNLNTTYMTLMLVTPMALVILVSMRSMFTSPPANIVVGAAAVAIFVVGFVGSAPRRVLATMPCSAR